MTAALLLRTCAHAQFRNYCVSTTAMLRSQNIFATLFCQKHIEFDQSLYEKAFSVSNSGIRIFLCINFRSNVFFFG